MTMGTGFPEQFAPILRMRNAGSLRHGKSPVMASSQKALTFTEAAANMRRISGSRGRGGRQDVLITEEADGALVGD